MHSELSVFARRQRAPRVRAVLAYRGSHQERKVDVAWCRSGIGRFLYRLRLSTSQKGEPKIPKPSASRLVGIVTAIIAVAWIAGQLYGAGGDAIDGFGQSVLAPTRSPQALPAAGAGCEPILYGDVNIDGAVELDDILCMLTGFSGSFVDCPLEFVDIMPCGGGNGVVDLDDILAVLGAIAGDPPCDQACLPCVDNVPPNAGAVPDLDVQVGEMVNFSASGSTDSDGLLVAYEWDWGDGTSARGEEVTHVFLTAGIFAVTLAVTDSCNASAIETATVTVREVSNNSLIADAGPDQTVIEGDEALFNASLSRAATAEVVSYAWDFGDCVVGKGALDTHTYSDPGTYTVTLTVTDADGNVATDTTEVTVNPSLITSANFAVYELVAVDKGDCQEVWQEVGLENEEIELGLRVRFEPTLSTGGIFHSLQFMDGSTVTYSLAPDAGDLERLVHAYDEPGVYNVRLRVWDAEGNVEIAEKAVTVAEGMQLLSTMPSSGVSFGAQRYTLLGNEVWMVSSGGHIGVADISDPYNLPALEIMPLDVAGSPWSLAASNGKLYLAKGMDGVDIYRADRNNFQLLRHLSADDLGGISAHAVAAVEDILYVSTVAPNEILVYDVEVGTAPLLIKRLPIWGEIRAQVGEDALIVHAQTSMPRIVDIRDPENPMFLDSLDLGVTLENKIAVYDHQVAIGVDDGDGTVIVDIGVPGTLDAPIATSISYTAQFAGSRFAFYPGKFFLRTPTGLWKYDVVQPQQPYLMQQFERAFGSGFVFMLDPDGPQGLEGPILYVVHSPWGLEAYKP